MSRCESREQRRPDAARPTEPNSVTDKSRGTLSAPLRVSISSFFFSFFFCNFLILKPTSASQQ